MKAQAAKSLVRKEKAHVGASKAATKKLSGGPGPGLKRSIESEVEAMTQPRQRKAPKSAQSQTHHRKKGTSQNPERSQERRERNVESGKTRVKH
ncbi:hypothetical protein QJS83_08615 [Bdellovibrio sp. 22V]|uniref:hypothetical protein n=1 Tax=Bdellovibrio TaxID=958 RepID=UPI00254291D2|nr:hypothetical protein [Bdellovibrio sp. 22V]WII73937.1 hypothetical protein QJS83_08615 [Bdellovibrio sp. 22V]